ncbi:MAG: N-acetylmuramoyl-L-alanine amidase [Lachnospiraceae bacterium]|nr:N-acetylmuramoyl-L-alanine amidase [Lachnospiraceae bacterium]
MANRVVIDAGHGGYDAGASYQGRKEKDDNLNLALKVGEILLKNCIDVRYTRTDDVYDSPYEKAVFANNSGADLFVSIHRNAYLTPNTSRGIETLVYNDEGIKAKLARNINSNLAKLGFDNRGVIERPNLVVLKRTKMPAVLVEAGFIDNEEDNKLFDEKFDKIADAIAMGIIDTIGGGCDENERKLYKVFVGAYNDREDADALLDELKGMGFPAYIMFEDGVYKVMSGAFAILDNAVKMEERLSSMGYNTYITT